MTRYQIKAGETLLLQLLASDDSSMISSVEAVVAFLKRPGGNNNPPAKTTPKIAEFTVEEVYNGWSFLLTSAQTALLDPGLYLMDAKLTLDTGAVRITDPLEIEVKGSVT